MNRQFHNRRQSLTVTDKQAGLGNYSIHQKKFTGHMFNIKLEEKSYKMDFKVLPVKMQQSKNRQGETMWLRKGQIGFRKSHKNIVCSYEKCISPSKLVSLPHSISKYCNEYRHYQF